MAEGMVGGGLILIPLICLFPKPTGERLGVQAALHGYARLFVLKDPAHLLVPIPPRCMSSLLLAKIPLISINSLNWQ